MPTYNKKFTDVQLFESFLEVLQNADGTRRKTLDNVAVDLLSNLDPYGRTNLAIELAKIYSWYNQLFNYTAPVAPADAGSIEIKPAILPGLIIHEGYYDSSTDTFYEDSAKTTAIVPVDHNVYIDEFTNDLYVYNATETTYIPVSSPGGHTYAFSEGTTDGSFAWSIDGIAQSPIRIHNGAVARNGYYHNGNFYENYSAGPPEAWTDLIAVNTYTLYKDIPSGEVWHSVDGSTLIEITGALFKAEAVYDSSNPPVQIPGKFKIVVSYDNGVTYQDFSTPNIVDIGIIDSGTGKVDEDLLPSYVDDVIEGYLHYVLLTSEPTSFNPTQYYKLVDGEYVHGEVGDAWAAGTWYTPEWFEDNSYTTRIEGERGKIYVDLATNDSYRCVPGTPEIWINIANPISASDICDFLQINYVAGDTIGDFIGVDTGSGNYTLLTGSEPSFWGEANTFYTKSGSTYSVVTFTGSGTAGDPYVPSYSANTYYVVGIDGQHGLVPKPQAAHQDQNKYLKGDGTWSSPIDDINTLIIFANNNPSIT